MKNVMIVIINRIKEILFDFNEVSGDEWIGGILLHRKTFSVLYSTLYMTQEIMTYMNEDDMKDIKSLCEKIKPFTSKSHVLVDNILYNILSK